MLTALISLALTPHKDVDYIGDARYQIVLNRCTSCNHKHCNYIHVPGIVMQFETKEQFQQYVTHLAGKYWDRTQQALEIPRPDDDGVPHPADP